MNHTESGKQPGGALRFALAFVALAALILELTG
jgi:hypothetical protein